MPRWSIRKPPSVDVMKTSTSVVKQRARLAEAAGGFETWVLGRQQLVTYPPVSSNMAQRKSVKNRSFNWETIDKRRILCCNDGFPGNRVSVAPSDLVSRKPSGSYTPYQIQFEISPWSFSMFYYIQWFWGGISELWVCIVMIINPYSLWAVAPWGAKELVSEFHNHI